MSCWVPIFKAAGLWVLRTTEGKGEMDGERDGDGDTEDTEEDEEACLVPSEDGDGETCLGKGWHLSTGEGERGVGGSEEFKEESDKILEVELWEGVRVRREGGEELDVEEREASSQ